MGQLSDMLDRVARSDSGVDFVKTCRDEVSRLDEAELLQQMDDLRKGRGMAEFEQQLENDQSGTKEQEELTRYIGLVNLFGSNPSQKENVSTKMLPKLRFIVLRKQLKSQRSGLAIQENTVQGGNGAPRVSEIAVARRVQCT